MDREKYRKLINHINAIASGMSLPRADANGGSAPINNMEDKDARSAYWGKNESPAIMSAESHLKSQEVALLVDSNQT